MTKPTKLQKKTQMHTIIRLSQVYFYAISLDIESFLFSLWGDMKTVSRQNNRGGDAKEKRNPGTKLYYFQHKISWFVEDQKH